MEASADNYWVTQQEYGKELLGNINPKLEAKIWPTFPSIKESSNG